MSTVKAKVPVEKWRQADADYRAKVVDQKAETALPVIPVSSVGDSLADALMAAMDTPALARITWSDQVPMDHPIRKLDVCVLLWGPEDWTTYFDIVDLPEALDVAYKPLEKVRDLLYWWTIGKSICDSNAKLLFPDDGPKEGSLLERVTPLAMKLCSRFQSPKHMAMTESMFVAAASFQGLMKDVERRDAKKPDTTNGSESSAESPVKTDVPSEKPAE